MVQFTELDVNPGRTFTGHVSGETSHEEAAKLYRCLGYTVVILTYASTVESLHKHVPEAILEQVKPRILKSIGQEVPNSTPLRAIEKSGVPDLFVYRQRQNGTYEYAFIEVKKVTDNLKGTQINWITEFSDLPTKVLFRSKY